VKTLIKYFEKRKSNIIALLEKPRSEYVPATFHELRVEIKKLNALLHLVEFCANAFERKKIFEPFKTIFRQAGKVRELQLEEAILKKHFSRHSLSDYRNDLKQQQHREQDEFFSMVNDKFISRLEKKFHKIVPFLEEVNKKKADRYLEERENTIKELTVHDTLQSEQAHELRKQLKTLNYNRKSLSGDKQSTAHLKSDTISELLGKWHDYQVMSGHLEKVISTGGVNQEEMKQLDSIKEKINSQSERIFKRINSKRRLTLISY
jgi:predicted RNase H-like nuclease (RuvC/YqgF family)